MGQLEVVIGRLKLKNAVMAASGTFGYGEEFNKLYPISRLGAVVTKGISLKPREGNPTPRIVETPSGMINAIGIQNVGIENFIKDKLPFLKKAGATTIVNCYGTSPEEYVKLAERLSAADGVAGLEINISCPNVASGGIEFGRDPKTAAKLVGGIRKVTKLPLIVKLSPSAPSIAEISKAIESEGADALSVINTIPAMVVDVKTRRPAIANVIGGLSGPAIRPVAVRMVYEAVKAVKIPVIGIGGITNLDDALQFFIVGARAIQVGTANFVDPNVCIKIIEGLESRGDLDKIIGSLSGSPLSRG